MHGYCRSGRVVSAFGWTLWTTAAGAWLEHVQTVGDSFCRRIVEIDALKSTEMPFFNETNVSQYYS